MIQSAHGPSTHIRYEDGHYQCPHCMQSYMDGCAREDRIFKSKRGHTWRRCIFCKKTFGICSNPMSGIRGFDLREAI